MIVSSPFGDEAAPAPTPVTEHPAVKLAIVGGLTYLFFKMLGSGSEPLPHHGKR